MERLQVRRLTQAAREQRLPQRAVLYCIGLCLCALGVVNAVNSGLGAPPPGAFKYVLYHLVPLTLGTVTAIMLTFYVLLQILILRRDFKWFNLAQVVAAAMFGAFVDMWRFLLDGFQLPTYFGQLTMTAASIIILAFGISLFVRMRFVSIPVEGLADAIAQKLFGGLFYRGKIFIDCLLAVLAIAVSLLFLGGLVGVREGTVLIGILVGKLIPHATRALMPLVNKLGIE